jgi:hypothetical protein
MVPAGLQKVVSVSTKFATCPSSSIPRELKRVPALRQDSRDMRVIKEGIPDLGFFRGEELSGIVMVLQKPRIADVSIRDESSAARSLGMRRERNSTRGLIMNEFQRNPSSKLSISNELELIGLFVVSLMLYSIS